MTRSGRNGRDAARSLKARSTELWASVTEARIQVGLTKEEMAELMHTDRSLIVRWDYGRSNNPTVATLEKIAEVTGERLQISFT